jgi:alkylation response protein AidB-like acyl-CoA dehydrogenase
MILTEDQRLVRDTARDFARHRLAPFASGWEETGEFPKDAVAEMAELGFFGMLVPEAWGGAGSDHVTYALALEEVAVGDGGMAGILSVQNSVVGLPILAFGSQEQKERWLRPVARGEILGGFCLTEPQAGSDAGNLKTRARRDGDGWVLSGTKQFITSGARADLAVVFAVSEPKAGKNGISAFLVPTDNPGYSVARIEDKLGQNASDTAQVVFDDLRLEADALLGDENGGYRIALSTLEGGRIGIAAQAVGMARAAYEAALAYAQEREAFGKPIIGHQAVAFRLADMATGIEAARQLIHHAATLADAGQPCRKEAAMAKLFASETAEKVCSDAIQVHGGYGYLKDFPVERIWRDVRVCRIYEGTSDIQRLIISREIAGN